MSLQNKNISHWHLDIIHGCGAQFVETSSLSKPQMHIGDAERLLRRNSGSAMESAYVKNCVGRCSQVHRDDDYGKCVGCDARTSDRSRAQPNDPVNVDAGGKRQPSGIQRRRSDVDQGERRNRAVDK